MGLPIVLHGGQKKALALFQLLEISADHSVQKGKSKKKSKNPGTVTLLLVGCFSACKNGKGLSNVKNNIKILIVAK